MVYKFIVNSRSTAPGLPPSMNAGTIEIREKDIEYEHELIREIYAECGEGLFTVLSNLGEKHLKKIWKGKIEVEDEEDLNYLTLESQLLDKTWIKIKEPPLTGRWKRCRKPVRKDYRDDRELLT